MPTQMDQLLADKQKKIKKLEAAVARKDFNAVKAKEAQDKKAKEARERLEKAKEEARIYRKQLKAAKQGLTKAQMAKIERANKIITRRRQVRRSRSAAMKNSAKSKAANAASKPKRMAGLKEYWADNIQKGYVIMGGKMYTYLTKTLGFPVDFVESHSLNGDESKEDLKRIKKNNAKIITGKQVDKFVGSLFD